MGLSKIEWCERVYNPVTGCTKISPGCQNCYAERMSKRLAGRCGYPADEPFRVTLQPNRIDEPLHWKKPSKIFVCSMSDLFHDDVPFEYIAKVWEVFYQCGPCKRTFNDHTFIVLTKRPERMFEFAKWYREEKLLPINYSNVWLGVTAENQEQYDKRWSLLSQIPAAVTFVSGEPLLGDIDITKHETKPDWFICGGESGPKRRPAQIDWFRSLRDQCVQANIPFFLKQAEIDGELIKMPKLDGRTWDEYPGESGCKNA